MKLKTWTVMAVVAVFALLAAPVALAQDGNGDKVLFGGSFTLRPGERLDGDLTAFGSMVSLEQDSTVRGDVVVFGGSTKVAGQVTGSVVATGGRVLLAPTAVVAGDVVILGSAFERAPGAVIRGQVLTGLRPLRLGGGAVPAPAMEVRPPAQRLWEWLQRLLFWQLRTLGSALLFILIGLAVLLAAPKGVARVAGAAATQPAVSFGLGLLTLLLALFAGALLLLACGLGLLVWLALAVGLVLGWIGVGLWVGRWLLGLFRLRTASSIPELALGILLITVLANLPLCIGFLFWLAFSAIGLGAVVATRFGTESAAEEPLPPAPSLPPESQTDLQP